MRKFNIADGQFDIAKIKADIENVGTSLDKNVEAPIITAMREHNKSVENLNNAMQANKYWILKASDSEKQQKIRAELERVSRFYSEFCVSPEFQVMKTEIGKHLTTVIGTSKALEHKIESFRSNSAAEEQEILTRSDYNKHKDIHDEELAKVRKQNLAAMEMLVKYKSKIDVLPDSLSKVGLTVERFCLATESMNRILIKSLKVMELSRQLEEGQRALDGLVDLNSMVSEISSCRGAVTEIVTMLAEGVTHRLDGKT